MIVVVGEALIDRIVHANGSTQDVAGGGPFNAARALAALGQPTMFLGGISTDSLGDTLALALSDVGVVRPLPRRREPTGIARATIDASGSAQYQFELNGSACAKVTIDDVRDAWPTVVPAALHVGTLGLVLQPLADAVRTIVHGADCATLVFVDPNCRPSIVTNRSEYLVFLHGLLQRADVVKVSDDDLAYISPGVDAVAAARALHADTGALILLTQGSDGVWVLGNGFEAHLPAVPVAVVDTVGAGDVFGAAWLAHWLNGDHARADIRNKSDVLRAVNFALHAAAWTCAHAGAQVPTTEDVRGADDLVEGAQ